jgi:hypothetical protein
VQQGSTLRNGRLHGKGKGDGIEGLSLQVLEVVRMSSLLLVPLGLDANNRRCRDHEPPPPALSLLLSSPLT